MNAWLAMALLALAIGAAVVIVVVIRRRRTAVDIGPATGFVAGAYALVIGLLLVAVIDHFDTARYAVLDETVAAAALFDNAEAFPTQQRIAVQHAVVCLLRSTVDEEWPTIATGSLTGDARTWQRQWQVNAALTAVEPAVRGQIEFENARANLEQHNEARVKRLYEGQTLLTHAHWAVLLVGAFLVVVLVGLELNIRDRPVWFGIFTMLIVTLVLLLAAIAFIDRPYTGWFRVTANPIQASLDVLRQAPGSDEAFRPCAPLAQGS